AADGHNVPPFPTRRSSDLEGASAPGAYREGDEGRQMGQGESFATAANPLALRQSTGRLASDEQSRQKHGWRGPSSMEHAREEGRSEEHTSELQSLAYLVCR